jgi:phosphate transport system substrate-binding protein
VRKLLFILGCCIIFIGCGETKSVDTDERDTPSKGKIYISVDESFKPVMEEQIKVYESSFPNAKIIASYKSEAECFKDLQKDSTRMIFVARGLTDKEAVAYKQQLLFKPLYGILAYDAVALIVNRQSKDSIFTIKDIKEILSGRRNITAVMDGKNATSTVRFLIDSILRGDTLGRNVVASKSSRDVIDIVSKNSSVIGFVGLSWVGNGYDKEQLNNLKTIRYGLVECLKCAEKDAFAAPSQYSITYSQYPLARPLYYILKENATGLGTGFMNFLGLERGQLIFRRSFLVPAKMNFKKRAGSIDNEE